MMIFILIALYGIISTIESASISLYHNKTNEFNGIEGYILYHNQSISFINGSDWNYSDAMVACRELGFQGVASFESANVHINLTTETSMKDSQAYEGIGPCIINTLCCEGQEEKLCDCYIGVAESIDSSLFESGQLLDIAKVSCTGFQTVRLSGGATPREGRVEIFYNCIWGSVCDDYWGKPDADVVCRQLGYEESLNSIKSYIRPDWNQKIWIDNINCTGTETSLLLCSKNQFGTHDCNHVEDASVICKMPSHCNILPSVANANHSRDEIDIGSEVFFKCLGNSTLVGPKKLTCLPNGVWSEPVPHCVPKHLQAGEQAEVCYQMISNKSTDGQYLQAYHCPRLWPLINGQMNTTENTVGVLVMFKCDPEYVMIGNIIINCILEGKHGIWNGLPPTCCGVKHHSSLMPISSEIYPTVENKVIAITLGVFGAIALTVIIFTLVTFLCYLSISNKQKRQVINELSIPLVTTSDSMVVDNR